MPLGKSRQSCSTLATTISQKSASTWPPVAATSESVMIERTRLISIWSPRITPRMKGASGKPQATVERRRGRGAARALELAHDLGECEHPDQTQQNLKPAT